LSLYVADIGRLNSTTELQGSGVSIRLLFNAQHWRLLFFNSSSVVGFENPRSCGQDKANDANTSYRLRYGRVLIDSEELHAHAKRIAFAHAGSALSDADLRSYVGRSDAVMIERGRSSLRTDWRAKIDGPE
jgi:hypothetical protein